MDSENQQLKAKIVNLQEKNKELSKQLETHRKQENEFLSYQLYKDAQKRLLGFTAIITIILTGFGVVSINSIIEGLQNKIEEYGTEKVISDVKNEFVIKYKSDVLSEVTIALTPKLEARIDATIRDQLINTAEEVGKSLDKDSGELSTAIKNTYSNKTYYVIGMTSSSKKDIYDEIQRVENKLGSRFEKDFPDIDVYAPLFGAKTLLISSTPLPFEEANKLKARAIDAGFSRDTWLWGSDVAYFIQK